MKSNAKIIAVLCFFIFAAVSCAQSPSDTSDIALSGSEPESIQIGDAGQVARQHLEAISEEIGARWPGTPEEAETAEYVKDALAGYGYQVQTQPFEFTDEDGQSYPSENIMAVKEGESGQEIIVGAHYDSSDEGDGADDNASGVAVLLEVAMRLKGVETPYTVRFIAFGAEENDLDGSTFFVDQLSDDEIGNIVGMVNLDSVIAGDYLYIYADVNDDSQMQDRLMDEDVPGIDFYRKTLEDLNEDDGTACECADYQAFSDAGIPFAYIEATNWTLGDQDGYTQVDPHYGDEGEIIHTQYDTVDTIDRFFPGRIDRQLNFIVNELVDLLINLD